MINDVSFILKEKKPYLNEFNTLNTLNKQIVPNVLKSLYAYFGNRKPFFFFKLYERKHRHVFEPI